MCVRHLVFALLFTVMPALAWGHSGGAASPDLVVAYQLSAGRVQLGLNLPPKVLSAITEGRPGTPEDGWDLGAPLDLEAQKALFAQLSELIATENAIHADGAALKGTLSQLTLVHDLPHARLDDLPKAPNVALHSSPWRAVQLRVDYPYTGGALTFAWTLKQVFPGPTTSPKGRPIPPRGIPATLYPGGDAQPIPFTFTAEAPSFSWSPTPTKATAKSPTKAAASTPPPAETSYALPLALGLIALVIIGFGVARRAVRVPAFMLGGGLLFGAGLTGWVSMMGGGPMGPEAARTLFEDLHRNIYTAFDADDPDTVYTILARSVDGPLLDTVYTEVYQSLILKEDGEVRTEITEVDLQEAVIQPDEPAEPGGFVVKARWKVTGEVSHWGHGHRRVNQYSALYTVAPRPDGWRLVATELLDQTRETVDINIEPAKHKGH